MHDESARLEIPEPSQLRGPFPPYQRPAELLSYSLDEDRHIQFDDRELSCYYPPPLGSCLFDRMATYKTRDLTVNEHLDNLLTSLVHAKREKSLPSIGRPRFLTFRGILTKILCLPYNSREGWELGATLYKGTIHLEEHMTEDRLDRERALPQHVRRLMYSGYRFETVSTLDFDPRELQGRDDPRISARYDKDTNNLSEFNCVFKTKLGDHSILMGAEIDCVCYGMEKEGRGERYLELKTSTLINSPSSRESFEKHKLLRYYIQSFLAGIPQIHVGFRDPRGVLRAIRSFKTAEIPRLVRNKNYWDPSVCFRFADRFLTWLTEVITVDDPHTSYTIRYDPATRTVTASFAGPSGAFLIPDYVEEFETW
ncbi:decapping endonuclease targeting mRNA [Tieghemiomyces parasiticus]|uniref:Decapping nuclease n=1 Tax=Tieghemiomyces parasiticus TaxID=78921 RepID=A0A9W8DLU9_9FUNG|nr:decapping endonuclease targeting mRNA [Tieghemiomyces parasiticus]